jgi:two-component system, cell cycle sensor histidine kinase and response regulator CckA
MSRIASNNPVAGFADQIKLLRVLIIENSRSDAELILQELRKAGFKFRADLVETPEEFSERLHAQNYDVVLSDYLLPQWTGMDALSQLQQMGKDIPFLLVTGALGEEAAVECVKQGVTEYVLKDRLGRLPVAVRRALEEKARPEARRAEQAQQESEVSFRLLFANNPLPMWVFDLETLKFLQVNDAAIAHYGYSREEFTHMQITDIHPVKEIPRLLQWLAKERSPLRASGQWLHRLKDGGITGVEIALHTLELSGRRAALVVVQDSTERQQAEETLHESEERYRQLFDSANDGLFVFAMTDEGLPGRFLEVNQVACQMLGYSREELLRLSPMDVEDPGATGHPAAILDQLRTEKRVIFERELIGKDSRRIQVEISSNLFDFKGQAAVLSVARDISERRQAGEALRTSEARYRELVKNATYGIFRASREGRFLDVNPALVAILGYASEEEILSLNLGTDVYRDPVAWTHLLGQAAGRDRVESLEVKWKRKDGSPVLVRLSGRAVRDPAIGVICFEGIAEDVSERRALEKQLRQVQKFEAIGQLAGGIAHDFNNVIGAIQGWAELGGEQVPSGSPLHSHFKKIREQADRAAALTRQLLAFARRQILEPQDIHLNKTIADLLSLFERLIGKDIELKTVLAPNLGAIRADRTQVEQVLMNLCLNARDAMPRGGQLLIETQDVQIDVGMDAPTLEHIFEPFFTTKEIGKGTGLGLATVYGVVKQHGGFVHVYSEPGRGTTFHVYFPASTGRPGKNKRKANAAANLARGGTETILVGEDHDGIRELARATLEALGYRVMLATNGEEAVRVFEAHRDAIGMALLDVVMPKLGGPDAYTRMAAAKPGLPVLFTTGYSAQAASLDVLVENGAAILQKPYSSAHLGRKVREILDGTASVGRGRGRRRTRSSLAPGIAPSAILESD